MYLGLCAAGEHFWEYRILAKERILEQQGLEPLSRSTQVKPEPVLVDI